MTEALVHVRVTDMTIDIEASIDITEVNRALLRVLPTALDLQVRGPRSVTVSLTAVQVDGNKGSSIELEIPLQDDARSVRFGDLVYGALRFLLSSQLAERGLVVADAATIQPKGLCGFGTLVTGHGKSTVSCRAVDLGYRVLSDDVVLLRNTTDGVVATASAGGAIRSRSGRSADLGSVRTQSILVRSTAIVQAAFEGAARVEEAARVDRSSWWCGALSGRVLNTRSFPESFAQPLLGAPSERAISAIAEMHRAIVALPCWLVLGDVSDQLIIGVLG